MKAYTPPLCLWHLVEQHVTVHEQDEIKSMLGVSLVEQSQELHREIETLLEIWRDMRDEKTTSVSPECTLAEPPDQRDRLVQEICFFVSSVKEKAEEKGIDPKLILKRHNSQILDYAAELNTRPRSSKTSLSSSSDGRETPLMASTNTRDNLDLYITDGVQAVNKKLNYLDFDEVCENLRFTLEREVDQLMEDILFLQNCLDSEADFRDNLSPQLSCKEPTLSELREERSQLEKDLLAANKIAMTPQVVKPNFNTSNMVPPLTPPASSEISSPKTRRVPLKADHSVIGAVGGESEIKSVLRNTDISPTLQVKEVSLLKSPIAGTGQNSNKVKTHVGYNVRADKNTGHSKSNLALNEPDTRSSVPDTSAPSLHKIDVDLRQSPGSKTSPEKISGHNQLVSSSKATATKHTAAAVTMGVVRRRTVSPGRVRVVEFTAIVDTHSKRGDSGVSGLSSASSSTMLPVISPSPPSSSLKTNSATRPGSAHAKRFRNMVLGCRNGD